MDIEIPLSLMMIMEEEMTCPRCKNNSILALEDNLQCTKCSHVMTREENTRFWQKRDTNKKK